MEPSARLADRLEKLSPVQRELLLRSLLGSREPPARERIPPRPAGDGPLPLSFAQERLWILDRLSPGIPAYHLSSSFRVAGPLDLTALHRSLDELVRRHEALRTVFPTLAGRPVQAVLPAGRVAVEEIDLRSFLRSRRESEAAWRAEQEARRPFHLAHGPLFRASLLRIGDADHLLLLSMHHIVADGWSLGILQGELAALYDAFSQGRAPALPTLPIQYPDFALWQRASLAGERLERLLGYWTEALRGAPPLLELPTDRPRPPVQSFRGATLPFSFPPELAATLRAFAAGEGATLFMVLLAAFAVLLSRRSGQQDLAVGTPVAGRTRPEIEPLIGCFINTLPLRIDLAGDPGFRALVAHVREVTLAAFAHQELPFEKLVEELQPERSLSYNPLVQVMLALQNTPAAAGLQQQGGAPASGAVGAIQGTAKFDLTVALTETADGLEGGLEHDTDLFDEETARQLAAQLRALTEAALEDPDRPVSRLRPLSDGERATILGWSEGGALADRGIFLHQSLHQWLELHAAQRPGAPALEMDGRVLTYAELNRWANRIARRLHAGGVGLETRVGLFFERSPEMIASLLGVLKAGAAYVPLDPAYPAERLAFLFSDSQTRVVLAQEHLLPRLPAHGADVLCVGSDPAADGGEGDGGSLDVPLAPDHLAYIIYTSGSTGRPKGAMLSHRGLAVLIAAQRHIVRCTPEDRVLQLSTLSFDASVYELALAYGAGAALCLAAREDVMPGPELVRLLRGRRITACMFPPSVLAQVPEDPGPGLRTILVAGEACPADLVERWAPGRRFVNCYGPTETTVWATFCDYSGTARPPVVGRPLPNTRAFVLDLHLNVVPAGEPGEIALGGMAVGRGYLGRPELTAERFVPDPWSGEPGARLYRTGDLGRYRSDGRLEYLRRLDDQVKLRGFRIEPREIEAVLLSHPAVAQVAVVVREDRPGDKRIVAYAAPGEGRHLSAEALRRHAAERLPSHMVPSACVVLEALPLTVNGKLDRRALPAPQALPDPGPEPALKPSTTAAVVARIWQDVLRVPQAGGPADFFEMGGHSLLATQVTSRLSEALGAEVPVRLLFENPEFTAYCAAVEQLVPVPRDRAAIPRRPREEFRVRAADLSDQAARSA
ncbi:MAG TPA: amino acid adenylation domain-containing protein [Thermoanaerobaculia bacterium]|nr:amino acid adenylation domain-containing protein [Thermoanaerobaculia bacterium]